MTYGPLKKIFFRIMLAAICASTLGADCWAQSTGRSLVVTNAWARLGRDDRRSATVYFVIANRSDESDALVGVWSPIAEKASLSAPHWRGLNMTMRPLAEIPVSAHGVQQLRPGAQQVDVVQISRELRPGQSIPLELRFEKAGRVEVSAVISNRLLPDELRAPLPDVP
jgi:copper(I)-binding protein